MDQGKTHLILEHSPMKGWIQESFHFIYMVDTYGISLGGGMQFLLFTIF